MSFLGGLGNVLSGIGRQINPFDNGATYSNPQPVQTIQTPQAPAPQIQQPPRVNVQQLMQAMQQHTSNVPFLQNQAPNPFLQRLSVNGPSPLQEIQHFAQDVKNLPGQIVTGVKNQAGRALTELSATPLNVFTPKPQDVVENNANQTYQLAIQHGMLDAQAKELANQVRLQGYQTLLGHAGFNMNDSKATLFRKSVGNIGGTVANVLPVGEALKATSLAGRVGKSAAFGGTANGISNLASDNLTPGSELKAIAQGAAVGGALPGVVDAIKATKGAPIGLSMKDVSKPGTNVTPVPKPNVTQSNPAVGVRAGTARINKAMGTDLAPSLYNKSSNATLKANASNFAAGNLDAATAKVEKQLSQTPGRLTAPQLANAYAVAEKHASLGNVDKSNSILQKTLPHDTKTAQSLAARNLMSQATPGGMQKMVLSAFDKAGVTLSDSANTKINSIIQELHNTAPGSAERQMAAQKLGNEAVKNIPRSKFQAAQDIFRFNVLSGPTTAAKVLLSQPFGFAQSYANQFPAAAFDAMRSAVTGAPRTVAAAPFKGIGSGLVSGIKDMGTKLKSNIDVPGSGGFQRDLKTQLAVGHHTTPLEQKLYATHSGFQKPVNNMIRNNTLARLGKAQAINQGLKGAERRAFVTDYVKNPPQNAYEHALNMGEESVNQQKTAIGDLAGKVQQAGHGAGTFVLPVTRVPGALVTNALYNYSGLKFAKTAVVDGLMKHGVAPDHARTLAESFGKGVVGAGGIGGVGALLGARGDITPPKATSNKDAALFKLQGKPLGSVKIPGTNTWISLSSLGPLGIELASGAGFGRGTKDGGVINGAVSALAYGGQEMAQQPMIKGISSLDSALNNPQRSVKSYVNNFVGSTVPAAVSQTATGFDSKQRQIDYNSAKDTLKSKIPGLRENIPATSDILGGVNAGANPSNTFLGGVAGTLDAFKPSQQKGINDPTTKELSRLQSTLPSADSPSISTPLRSQTVNGKLVTLNDNQLASLTQAKGDIVKQGVNGLINTPEYKNASDTGKSAGVKSVISDAEETAKQRVLGSTSGTSKNIGVLTNDAIIKAASDTFANSKSNYQVVAADPNNPYSGTVLTKDTQGKVQTTPVVKYNYELGKSQMTYAKNSGDKATYLATAQSQLNNINHQLNDPNTSPKDAITLKNDAYTLYKEMNRAQSGGLAFGTSSRSRLPNKPSGFRLGKAPSVKIAKIATLKAPKLAKVRTSKVKLG